MRGLGESADETSDTNRTVPGNGPRQTGHQLKGVETGQLALLRILSRIASVPHAVVVLGLNVVKGLTLCASSRDIMKDAGLGQLWRHSLGVAITAQLLDKRLEMKNGEEVFVAGLLHDIGKVILYVKWPDVGKKINAVNPSGNRPMMQVGQDLYEVSHAEVGGWLANAWHLPATPREPILYHHQPGAVQDAQREVCL